MQKENSSPSINIPDIREHFRYKQFSRLISTVGSFISAPGTRQPRSQGLSSSQEERPWAKVGNDVVIMSAGADFGLF